MHRQVVVACRWPVPSGQATKERKQKKRKERRERFSPHNFSGENPKPRRTSQRTSTQKAGRSNKDQSRKTSSISCCLQHKTRTQEGQLGETKSQHNSCPNGLLSQEELFKEHQTGSPSDPTKINREKRAVLRAICNKKHERQKGQLGENNWQTKLVRAEP